MWILKHRYHWIDLNMLYMRSINRYIMLSSIDRKSISFFYIYIYIYLFSECNWNVYFKFLSALRRKNELNLPEFDLSKGNQINVTKLHYVRVNIFPIWRPPGEVIRLGEYDMIHNMLKDYILSSTVNDFGELGTLLK